MPRLSLSEPKKQFIKFAFPVTLLILFSISRFYGLSERPLHSDEAINADISSKLIHENYYRYNPEMLHGPTLYYLQFLPRWLNFFIDDQNYEVTPFSLRATAAGASLLLLIGFFFTNKLWGTWGAGSALVLGGTSLNLLYYSRYFIHEILVVLFTFFIYLFFRYFFQTRKIIYLYFSAASSALLFSSKETFALNVIPLSLAYPLAAFTQSFLKPEDSEKRENAKSDARALLINAKKHFFRIFLTCFLIWMFFFSSFFTNFGGLWDSVSSFFSYGREAVETGHNKTFFYYLKNLLYGYEQPLCFLAFMGSLLAFFKKSLHGIALFFWMATTFILYSSVPYKTPWLVLNIILPMTLVSAYGVSELKSISTKKLSVKNQKIFLCCIAILVAITFFFHTKQILKVVYIEYDSPTHPQVYSHTYRDVYRLLNDIDRYSKKTQINLDTPIIFLGDEYWPMPFYLSKYANQQSLAEFNDPNGNEKPLILLITDDTPHPPSVHPHFCCLGAYRIRPSRTLFLYGRCTTLNDH